AVLLIPLWLFFLLGGGTLQPALPALHWHQHEMLGAFVNSAIAGFLLTAVCAWTGTRPVAGWPLAALWLLWLAGRGAMLFGSYPWLAMAVDLAFLPAVALLAARPIVAKRQWRQLPLLAVLTLLWLCDLGYHLSGDTQWLRAAMLLTGGLILVVGGRITPAFSRNWLLQQGQPAADISTWRWLDIVTLASTLLLVLAEASRQLPVWLVALVALVAGLSAALRTLLWRGWRVRREPLLAILHIG
ncbi:MAG TPA: NnrS family protein, partial [Halieaceae bacterium]|nr:NnrS family protein [Halieaceae bacterium]